MHIPTAAFSDYSADSYEDKFRWIHEKASQ